MIDIKEVVKNINAVIAKNASANYSAITFHSHAKPFYNNGTNIPVVCKLNMQCCKDFYKGIENEKRIDKTCPMGFLVSKKSFDTSTKFQKINLYSIVSYFYSSSVSTHFAGLARDQKKFRDEAIRQLQNLSIDNQKQKEHKEFLEELIDTLLIGRIGLAIQSISHQFFTPLQGAMSDVKNIEAKNDLNNSLQRLQKNFDSLNKLATEIQLLLSTSEEFNKNMLRKVQVHTMVNKIFSGLQATANEKHILLRQGFNSHFRSVEAIPGQLNIVLTNIIHNAIFVNPPLRKMGSG